MGERQSTRREFLAGTAALKAIQNQADSLENGQGSLGLEPTFPSTAALLTLTRRAMACEFQVCLNASQTQNETLHALAALDCIETMEDRLTVYHEGSEVQQINRKAVASPTAVEQDLFALVEQCGYWHDATKGAFDATSGPLSTAWGFNERCGRVPSDDDLAVARSCVGWEHVELSCDSRTIRFRRSGVQINFNSVGKGYALDHAAQILQERGVRDFLLHGGRSTLVAQGARAGAPQAGWGVGVRHPLRPRARIAEFSLHNQAFSTSGSATQHFVQEGRRYGHLIDPRTGWPAEGVHSVSVIAPTGAEADALSTAFYVMGPDAAEVYCEKHPQIAALFVLPGASRDEVNLCEVNLASVSWRPLLAR